jgi:CRP/FNR family transcriptional regulator
MKAIKMAKELIDDNQEYIRSIELSAGQIACAEDNYCPDLLVVKKGCLRVYKRSFDGRTFTLYRVAAGECCSLMISSILNKTTFPATIEVEDDVLAYVISAQYVRQCLRNDRQWQDYFFRSLTQKVTQLSDLTNNLVFNNMDSRIANLLCLRLGEERTICTTHQCIANEVGTSREVVSRSLRLLESQGYVKLMRGQIEIIHLDALKSFSGLH